MKDAFNANKADFTGINGGNDLFLTAFSQLNDINIGSRSSNQDHRQSRQQEDQSDQHHDHHQVLKFERQFLYAIRHNPSGMVTYLGRYYEPPEAQDHEHDHMHHS